MYDYTIESMAKVVSERLKDASLFPTIKAALSEFWSDKVADIWTVDDVNWLASTLNIRLTNEQSREVLKRSLKDMDANVGLNWSTLTESIWRIYNNNLKQEEVR